jgi:hypothetical protein
MYKEQQRLVRLNLMEKQNSKEKQMKTEILRTKLKKMAK